VCPTSYAAPLTGQVLVARGQGDQQPPIQNEKAYAQAETLRKEREQHFENWQKHEADGDEYQRDHNYWKKEADNTDGFKKNALSQNAKAAESRAINSRSLATQARRAGADLSVEINKLDRDALRPPPTNDPSNIGGGSKGSSSKGFLAKLGLKKKT